MFTPAVPRTNCCIVVDPTEGAEFGGDCRVLVKCTHSSHRLTRSLLLLNESQKESQEGRACGNHQPENVIAATGEQLYPVIGNEKRGRALNVPAGIRFPPPWGLLPPAVCTVGQLWGARPALLVFVLFLTEDHISKASPAQC